MKYVDCFIYHKNSVIKLDFKCILKPLILLYINCGFAGNTRWPHAHAHDLQNGILPLCFNECDSRF